MVRKSGPVTVGPVTVRMAPNRAAKGQLKPAAQCPAAAASTQVTSAPTLTLAPTGSYWIHSTGKLSGGIVPHVREIIFIYL